MFFNKTNIFYFSYVVPNITRSGHGTNRSSIHILELTFSYLLKIEHKL